MARKKGKRTTKGKRKNQGLFSESSLNSISSNLEKSLNRVTNKAEKGIFGSAESFGKLVK